MRRIVLWRVGGIAGSVVLWFVQVLTGGPTITEFIGQQIAAARWISAGIGPSHRMGRPLGGEPGLRRSDGQSGRIAA
jgi:hypothetical protein